MNLTVLFLLNFIFYLFKITKITCKFHIKWYEKTQWKYQIEMRIGVEFKLKSPLRNLLNYTVSVQLFTPKSKIGFSKFICSNDSKISLPFVSWLLFDFSPENSGCWFFGFLPLFFFSRKRSLYGRAELNDFYLLKISHPFHEDGRLHVDGETRTGTFSCLAFILRDRWRLRSCQCFNSGRTCSWLSWCAFSSCGSTAWSWRIWLTVRLVRTVLPWWNRFRFINCQDSRKYLRRVEEVHWAC